MGCYGSLEQATSKPPIHPRKDINTGTLTIKITGVFLHKTNYVEEKDMFLRFRVSNQSHTINLSQICTDPGSETEFTYILNSIRMDQKRYLDIQVRNGKDAKKDLGLGFSDLNSYLCNSRRRHTLSAGINNTQAKCCLNYRNDPAGFVQFQTRFQEQKTEDIELQLSYASILNPSQHSKKSFVRIIVGEEMQDCYPVIQKPEQKNLKFLFDRNMHFRIPCTLQTATIQLISTVGNNDNLLGSLQLNLKDLMDNDGEIHGKLAMDQIITGTILLFSSSSLKKLPKTNQEPMMIRHSSQKSKSSALATIQNLHSNFEKVENDEKEQDHKQFGWRTIQIRKKNSSEESSEKGKGKENQKNNGHFPSISNFLPPEEENEEIQGENRDNQKINSHKKLAKFASIATAEQSRGQINDPPIQIQKVFQGFHKRAARRKWSCCENQKTLMPY